MEGHLCTFSACESLANYICDCKKGLFCKMHILEHIKLSSEHHSIEPLFYTPNPDTCAALIKEIIQAKSEWNENKARFIESISHIIKNLENLIQKYTIETEFNFNDNFEAIKNVKKVSRLEADPILKLLILDKEEAIKIIRFLYRPEIVNLFSIERKFKRIAELLEDIKIHSVNYQ